MDTTTVLEIIKIIDNKIDNHILKLANKGFLIITPTETALTELRDHLQSFIEETEFPDPKSACSACGSHDPDHLCQL